MLIVLSILIAQKKEHLEFLWNLVDVYNKNWKVFKLQIAESLLIPQPHSDSGIELNLASGLPPEWVDQYEAIKSNLDKVVSLRNTLFKILTKLMKDKDLNGLISRRVADHFGKTHADLDAKIKDKNNEAFRVLYIFLYFLFKWSLVDHRIRRISSKN